MTKSDLKVTAVLVFIAIFFSKMVISTAPVIFKLDNKTVHAVIMQLEHENETKSDKDTSDKDHLKAKKSLDEYYTQLVRFKIHVAEVNILRNQEKLIYRKVYFAPVPTPPPNA